MSCVKERPWRPMQCPYKGRKNYNVKILDMLIFLVFIRFLFYVCLILLVYSTVSFHPEMTIENGNIDHEDVFDDEGLTTKVTMEAGAAEATTLEDQIKSVSQPF